MNPNQFKPQSVSVYTTPVEPPSLPMPPQLPQLPHRPPQPSQPRPNQPQPKHKTIGTRQRHRPQTEQGNKQSRVGTLRPKRLAETKGMSQAEWLNVRKQCIGSSDCAAACDSILICRCLNCG